MSASTTLAPGNVYVDLDALPASLKLNVGQNLIFVRSFSCAGEAFLRSLNMPAPCFVAADKLDYGSKIPGQPKDTFVLDLGLVRSAGCGEIHIRFACQSSCQKSPGRLVRLPFVIEA